MYYPNRVFTIDLDVRNMIGSNNALARLTFNDVKQLDVSLVEPWGPSEDIFSITFSCDNLNQSFDRYNGVRQVSINKLGIDLAFRTSLQLVSGDEINLISKSLFVEYFPESTMSPS